MNGASEGRLPGPAVFLAGRGHRGRVSGDSPPGHVGHMEETFPPPRMKLRALGSGYFHSSLEDDRARVL